MSSVDSAASELQTVAALQHQLESERAAYRLERRLLVERHALEKQTWSEQQKSEWQDGFRDRKLEAAHKWEADLVAKQRAASLDEQRSVVEQTMSTALMVQQQARDDAVRVLTSERRTAARHADNARRATDEETSRLRTLVKHLERRVSTQTVALAERDAKLDALQERFDELEVRIGVAAVSGAVRRSFDNDPW
jgi:hypothetical protein